MPAYIAYDVGDGVTMAQLLAAFAVEPQSNLDMAQVFLVWVVLGVFGELLKEEKKVVTLLFTCKNI